MLSSYERDATTLTRAIQSGLEKLRTLSGGKILNRGDLMNRAVETACADN